MGSRNDTQASYATNDRGWAEARPNGAANWLHRISMPEWSNGNLDPPHSRGQRPGSPPMQRLREIGLRAMARKDHLFWQDYQPWDNALVAAMEKRAAEERAASAERFAAQQSAYRSAQEARVREIAGYAEWCRTSPEWRDTRVRVLNRALMRCEACLVKTATMVHHQTYDYGRLPPAWHLRAVCKSCHARLHRSGDDWCDPGMERT